MKVEFIDEIESTNTELVNRGHKEQEDTVLVAFKQTKGKGRRGRSFYSPSESGLYMSFLVHPDVLIEDAFRLTTLLAVSACEAIEDMMKLYPLSEKEATKVIENAMKAQKEENDDNVIKIKWVNDLYKDNKKISGILTECSSTISSGKPEFLVGGIGINIFEPKGGFPDDIKDRAGAIYDTDVNKIDKELLTEIKKALAGLMVDKFEKYYKDFPAPIYLGEYKRRSFLIGKKVQILDGPMVNVDDIDEDFGLCVEHEDGQKEILRAGEVSLIL